jgi:hypothetical protein
MTTLESYAENYQTIRMVRRDDIQHITFHTNGGPLKGAKHLTKSSPRHSGILAATMTPRS